MINHDGSIVMIMVVMIIYGDHDDGGGRDGDKYHRSGHDNVHIFSAHHFL